MKFDVNKLLDFEYIVSFKSEITDRIDELNESFLEQYNLEKLSGMSDEEINAIFSKYDVNNENVLSYFDSDFIDSDWEFADLFEEDIFYSNNLKEEVKNNAISEIKVLNDKIEAINQGCQKKIDDLNKHLDFINKIVNLHEGVFVEEEIDFVKHLILRCKLSDFEKYNLSLNLVKMLIDKHKKTVDDSKEKEEVSEFEQILDDVYEENGVLNEEFVDTVDNQDSTYPETVSSYYDCYKTLFVDEGFGEKVGDAINTAYGLALDLKPFTNSVSTFDFCIELGALLYKLNELQSRGTINYDANADILMDLGRLDKLYDDDKKLTDKKDKLLDEIESYLTSISVLDKYGGITNKIKNRLNLLKNELKEKIINFYRMDEIVAEYKEIQKDLKIIINSIKQINRLEKLDINVMNALKNSYVNSNNSTDEYYTNLSSLKLKVAELIEKIKVSECDISFDKMIDTLEESFLEYAGGEKEKVLESDNNHLSLKGFVLFDYDENNKPYIVDDLDFNSKYNLIDKGVLYAKAVSDFSHFNNLISDLFVNGVAEILKDGTTAYMDRVLNRVYLDSDKKNPTDMHVIRPRRNSMIRFIAQRVIFRPGTEIYKQVINVIKEFCPNVDIDEKEEFVLYVNYATGVKVSDMTSYETAVKRYLRNSTLHNFVSMCSDKGKLTEDECNLLREAIKISLDAYMELETKCENLSFDILKESKGGKVHGV